MVEVTLRKANELEKAAIAAAGNLRPSTSIKISVFDLRQVDDLLEAGRSKIRVSLGDAAALIDAGYAIRALSSVKNREVGIDKLLLEKAQIEAKERQLIGLTTCETFENDNGTPEALAEKLKSVRARLDTATRAYGFDESVDVNLVTEDDKTEFTDMLAALRKRKTAVLDELMQRNWNNKINIPDGVVATLARFKIDVL